jgi:hypothetical protein
MPDKQVLFDYDAIIKSTLLIKLLLELQEEFSPSTTRIAPCPISLTS